MGKGDKKTKKGKRIAGSYGISRPRKSKSAVTTTKSVKKATAKISKPKPTETTAKKAASTSKPAIKKAPSKAKTSAAKKPAAKKTAAAKKPAATKKPAAKKATTKK